MQVFLLCIVKRYFGNVRKVCVAFCDASVKIRKKGRKDVGCMIKVGIIGATGYAGRTCPYFNGT